jgi:hypothetical protein
MRTKYTPVSTTLLAIASVAIAAACGGKDAQPAGGTPGREIQLAPSSSAQPQLNDAPAPAAATAPPVTKPAPKPAKAPPPQEVVVRPLNAQDNATASAPSPAPAPMEPAPVSITPAPSAPPAPAMGTVSAGVAFIVHPVARVCTNTFKAGDRFTATTVETIAGSDGVMIPAGSSLVLKVDESTRSENSKKVGAGALIGALAGQLLGKNTRSTVMGGAVGAAAGAAVAAGTADYDGCVPTTSGLIVNLDAPLRIRLLPN